MILTRLHSHQILFGDHEDQILSSSAHDSYSASRSLCLIIYSSLAEEYAENRMEIDKELSIIIIDLLKGMCSATDINNCRVINDDIV